MREKIINQKYDEERALYHLQHTDLEGCTFAGPADGESFLKEARDIGLKGCRFSLHCKVRRQYGTKNKIR